MKHEALTDLLIQMVARNDGIHPAHAANRVEAAWKLLKAIDNDRFGRPFGRLPEHRGLRVRLAEQAGVNVSPDSPTWDWVQALEDVLNGDPISI